MTGDLLAEKERALPNGFRSIHRETQWPNPQSQENISNEVSKRQEFQGNALKCRVLATIRQESKCEKMKPPTVPTVNPTCSPYRLLRHIWHEQKNLVGFCSLNIYTN